MNVNDGALVTDHSGHQIYLVQDGKLRWVPDAWTMQAVGASTADLVVLGDEDISPDDIGDPFPTSIPAPNLPEGSVVETEDGVWTFANGALTRVLDPMELVVEGGLDPQSVIFLPQSIVRSLTT